MKHWLKTSLLTILIVTVILVALAYTLDVNIAISSPAIEFTPGKPMAQTDRVATGKKPRNIIIFIADGMGFSHLSLAQLSHQNNDTRPIWQTFDVKSWHDPRSTYGPITDSGASGTAMATGTPTFFEVIGMDSAGNRVENVFEVATAQGYNTGIVTDSYIWDATPAAFVAHTKSRDNAREILTQLAASEVDLVFGELEDVGEDEVPELDETMEILTSRYQLLDESLKLPPQDSVLQPIGAIYEEDEIQDLDSSPNLPTLTETALNYLSNHDKPFILMVESEEMDAASHANNSRRVVKGLKAIQETLTLVLEYAKQDGETLVVFTADHETGGLAAEADFSNYPTMRIQWTTKDHTAAVVPILAKGPGAENFGDVHRNWEIGKVLKALLLEDLNANI